MAQHPNTVQIAQSRRVMANKTAIRYIVYWTLGVIALLIIDMFRRGIVPGNSIPMAVALPVFLLAGFAYWRATTAKERQRDAIRKLTDPTYE
jgi:protein-S-isoprenylcysteine O-methyltransferase Ste14